MKDIIKTFVNCAAAMAGTMAGLALASKFINTESKNVTISTTEKTES